MNIDPAVLNKAALKLMNDHEFVKATPVAFLDHRERSVVYDVRWRTKADYRATVAAIMAQDANLTHPDPTWSASILTDGEPGSFELTSSG